jgi:8-oxo-dGTP diphosphatase
MLENIQVVIVSGLLVQNDRVLIIKRASHESYLPAHYELPGGNVQFGEDLKECLEREFKEETNLKIKALMPYRTFSYLTEGDSKHNIEIVYFVKLEDDIKNIKLDRDHVDYKWLNLEDMHSLKITEEIKKNIVKGFDIHPEKKGH